jgi:hypothetical protein
MSLARSGVVKSELHKATISEAMKGRGEAIRLSEQHKVNISIANGTTIYQYTSDNRL